MDIKIFVLSVVIISCSFFWTIDSKDQTATASSSLFTASMPTNSMNEKNIDSVYGKAGLNIAQDDLMHIKQTYSYIETVVKSQKINKDPVLKATFSKYFTPGKSSSAQSQDIMNSPEWKAYVLKPADIQNSELWQLYLKSMIVDYYDNQADYVDSITMVQNQMFPYLANIELNFYNNDFIKLRLYAESLRAKKMLQDVTMRRYFAQCNDWSGQDQKTLEASIAYFKTTDFYKYTHNSGVWSATTALKDVTLQAYVMSYFMLITIQSTVQNLFTQKNLFAYLPQVSSATIAPNFIYYQPVDFVCFDDVLALQQESSPAVGKSFDLKDLVDMSQVNPAGVVIQKGVNLGKTISSVGKSTGDAIVDTGKSVVKEATTDVNQISAEAQAELDKEQKLADQQAAAANKLAKEQAAAAQKAAADAAKQSGATAAAAAAQKAAQDAAVKETEKSLASVGKSAGNTIASIGTAAGEGVAAGTESLSGSALVGIGQATGDQDLTAEGQKEKEDAAKQNAAAQKAAQDAANKSGATAIVEKETQNLITIGDKTAEFNKNTAQELGSGLDQTSKVTGDVIAGSMSGQDFIDVGTAAASMVEHGTTAIGQATVGSIAVGLGSATGEKSLSKWGNKENKLALQNAKITDKAFNNTIANLSKFTFIGIVSYNLQALILGGAGLGATLIGDIVYAQTGNASMKKWGEKETEQAILDFEKSNDDLNAIVTNTALVIEDGLIAPVALVAGAAVSTLLQNRQIGQDITLITDQILDTGVNVGVAWTIALDNVITVAEVECFKLAEVGLEVIVDSLLVVYGASTGQKQVENRSVKMTTADGKKFVNTAVAGANAVFSCVVSSAMDVVMSVMLCIAAVENSMTTIVFDLVEEITYLSVDSAQLLGAPVNAQQEKDKITAKMEAERGTINIVMGIVLMVVITVVTFGIAAPEAAGMISADIAGEAAVEGGLIAGSEVGTEVGVEVGVEVGAEGATTTAGSAAGTTTVTATDVAVAGAEATAKTVDIVAAVELTSAQVAATEGSAGAAGATGSAGTAGAAGTTGSAGATTTAGSAAGTTAAEAATEATAETATETVAETGTQTTAETATQTATETGTQTATDAASDTAKVASKAAPVWGMVDTAMLGINVAMSVFSVIGGENADDAAAVMLAQEKESIMNLWTFVESNKVVMTQGQEIFLDELTKKHQAAIGSQAAGLAYYTNYLNNTINSIASQMSHALSSQYIQMLTPDSTGSRYADIGSTWGLTTPFVYLYPSQGFITTTLGRKDFPYAQEIAQSPLIAQDQKTDSASSDKTSLTQDIDNPDSYKLWFNQRAVSIVDQAVDAPLNVEVKFRLIYNLTTEFHVGLYLGGKFYDYNSPAYLQDIKNTGNIHMDDAHLAKMFVFKRDAKEKAPSLGIYENEGKGWLVQKPLDASLLSKASIYHMSAQLNKDTLTVSFWPEDQPSSVWTDTVKVTPCDQKTFGIIFSGAALEWDVVTPSQPIQENKQVRTPTTTPIEADRERISKASWKNLKNPKFGSIALASFGKKYLLQGQYLYSTNDTPLKDINGQPLQDVVAYAIYAGGDVSNVGVSPTPSDTSITPNAIISMINGDIYDKTGAVVGSKLDPWSTFVDSNGPFDQALMDIVSKTQQNCPPKPVVVSVQTISFDDIDDGYAPSFGGFEFGLSDSIDMDYGEESFDDLQDGAAGGASFELGGFSFGGF